MILFKITLFGKQPKKNKNNNENKKHPQHNPQQTRATHPSNNNLCINEKTFL